jgi:hypothetical protein
VCVSWIWYFYPAHGTVREKLMVAQLIKRFPASQGTQRFVAVRFEGLTTATMKTSVFGDVALWSPVEVKRFVGTYCLHHQSRRGRQAQGNVKGLVAWLAPWSIWRKQYICPLNDEILPDYTASHPSIVLVVAVKTIDSALRLTAFVNNNK